MFPYSFLPSAHCNSVSLSHRLLLVLSPMPFVGVPGSEVRNGRAVTFVGPVTEMGEVRRQMRNLQGLNVRGVIFDCSAEDERPQRNFAKTPEELKKELEKFRLSLKTRHTLPKHSWKKTSTQQ